MPDNARIAGRYGDDPQDFDDYEGFTVFHPDPPPADWELRDRFAAYERDQLERLHVAGWSHG